MTDLFTIFGSVVLMALLTGSWLKLAHGDESESCCAVILLVLAATVFLTAALVWGVAALFG